MQFRQWATQELKEYMIRGVLNDDLLKSAEIDALLWNNLSDQLTDAQKKDKIRNLLQKWRHKGWIANETRGKISSWWLTIET